MKKKTVLAVEDDFEICNLYRFLLEKEGYIFYEAHSAREALIMLNAVSSEQKNNIMKLNSLPDLILLDIMLPEVDGYSFLIQISQNDRLKEIPVMIITAKSRMVDLFKTYKNVKYFFSKPFDAKVLRDKIIEILG